MSDLESKPILLLPEKVSAHPIAVYSKHVLDRIRVVQILWTHQNTGVMLGRPNNQVTLDPNRITEITKEVIKEFERREHEYDQSRKYPSDRPPWVNGKPSHNSAVPLNTDPEVVKVGIEWFFTLQPQFNQTLDMLDHDDWADMKVFDFLVLFKERLMGIYGGGIKDFPDNWLDPNVLVDFLIGRDKLTQLSLTIGQSNDAINIMESVTQKRRLVWPVFKQALRDTLLNDLNTYTIPA